MNLEKKIIKKTLQILSILIIFLILSGCNSKQTSPDLEKKIEKQLDAYFKNGQLNGNVLIVINSEQIINKSYGFSNYEKQIKNNEETQFYIASITKQFTAYAVLLLIEEGKLEINNYIGEFVDSLPPQIHYLTVEQLLSHTSGIRDWFSAGIYKPRLTNQEVINWLRKSELKFRPGYKFNYSNAGYILLAELIKNVSGLSYSQYINKNLFSIYGLDNTFVFDENTHKSNKVAIAYNHLNEQFDYELLTVGAGGIYSTCHDLYIWHQHLLKSNFANDSLFSRLYFPKKNKNGFIPPIGYGWAELKDYKNYVISNGAILGFRGIIIRHISKDIAIIILTNRTCNKTTKIGIEILNIIEGHDVELPRKPIKKTEVKIHRQILNSYTGKYNFNGYFIDVFINDDTLFYQEPGMKRYALFALNNSCFFTKSIEMQCIFHGNGLMTIENEEEKFEGKRINIDNVKLYQLLFKMSYMIF